jgi:hypothetical protein
VGSSPILGANLYFDVSGIPETWKFRRCVSLTLNLERFERLERAAVLIILYPFAFILLYFALARNPPNPVDYDKSLAKF